MRFFFCRVYVSNKNEKKKYLGVGPIPTSNIKIVESVKIDTHNTQIPDRLLSIKSGDIWYLHFFYEWNNVVMHVLFTCEKKMLTLTCNRMNSVIIKKVMSYF